MWELDDAIYQAGEVRTLPRLRIAGRDLPAASAEEAGNCVSSTIRFSKKVGESSCRSLPGKSDDPR